MSRPKSLLASVGLAAMALLAIPLALLAYTYLFGHVPPDFVLGNPFWPRLLPVHASFGATALWDGDGAGAYGPGEHQHFLDTLPAAGFPACAPLGALAGIASGVGACKLSPPKLERRRGRNVGPH